MIENIDMVESHQPDHINPARYVSMWKETGTGEEILALAQIEALDAQIGVLSRRRERIVNDLFKKKGQALDGNINLS